MKQKLFDLRLHSPYRWSRKEKELLKKQVRERRRPGTISVPGRTAVAVTSQLRYLRIFFHRWSKSQDGSLRGQFQNGKPAEQIIVLGKTSKAISKRLHALGLIKTTRWTEDEIQQLRQQASRGKAAPDIRIRGRSKSAIYSKAKALGLALEPSDKRWAKQQLSSLREQSRTAGSPLGVHIPGRTAHAVRIKMKRLQLYQPRKWTPKPWKISEVRKLGRLVVIHSLSARQIAEMDPFRHRTIDSIAQQMRRHRLVSKREWRQKGTTKATPSRAKVLLVEA